MHSPEHVIPMVGGDAGLGVDHLILGGGGLRKMYLNDLFIFSQDRNNFFILPAVKNKFFFFVGNKGETIFLALIFANLQATP